MEKSGNNQANMTKQGAGKANDAGRLIMAAKWRSQTANEGIWL